MNGLAGPSEPRMVAAEYTVPRSDPSSCRTISWTVVLAVALLTASALPESALYRGDERFYTDAAIQMRHSGDWWIPRDAARRPRYVKPLLFYWAVAISQSVFGPSLWSSRLTSWLAGLALLGTTWRLATTCHKDPRVAAWAVILLGTNPQFALLATRATPDMMLTLGLTLSVWGFVRWILREERTRGAAAAVWGGSALTMATKGLWGLAPIAHALFWTRFGIPRIPWRCWWSWPWALSALVLGASGYWIMVALHGTSVISAAWHDQVGLRLQAPEGEGPPGVLRPLVYAGTMFRDFLPWTALALAGLGKSRRKLPLDPCERHAEGWLMSWVLGMAGLLSLASFVRLRYVFPLCPALAVGLGNFLVRATDEVPGLVERWDRWSRGLALAAAAGSAGVALLAKQLEIPVVGPALGLTAIFSFVGFWGRRTQLDATLLRFSVVPLAWSAWFALVWAPVQTPSPARDIARVLAQRCANLRDVVLVGDAARLAGQLRLFLDGRPWVLEMPPSTTPEQVVSETAVLVIGTATSRWSEAGRDIRCVGRLPPSSFGRWWRAVRTTGNHRKAIEASGQAVWLALRRAPPTPQPEATDPAPSSKTVRDHDAP